MPPEGRMRLKLKCSRNTKKGKPAFSPDCHNNLIGLAARNDNFDGIAVRATIYLHAAAEQFNALPQWFQAKDVVTALRNSRFSFLHVLAVKHCSRFERVGGR